MSWSPETLYASHDKLRESGFSVVSLVHGRLVSRARASLGEWLKARQRGQVIAPASSADSALAAYHNRTSDHASSCHSSGAAARPGTCDRATPPTCTLVLLGEFNDSLKAAHAIAKRYPRLPIAVATTTEAVLGCLLSPETPVELVSTALQGAIGVDASERGIFDKVAKGRNMSAFLRGPSEGLVYYMLEARAQTRGLFEANGRIPKPNSSGSYEIDILCAKAKLAIEIDGKEHNTTKRQRQDEAKQRALERAGYRVRRFANDDVINDPVAVWRLIEQQLMQRLTENTG